MSCTDFTTESLLQMNVSGQATVEQNFGLDSLVGETVPAYNIAEWSDS